MLHNSFKKILEVHKQKCVSTGGEKNVVVLCRETQPILSATSFPGSSWSWPRRGEKTQVKYVEHSTILGILSHAQ